MFSLIRSGPRILLIKTSKMAELIDWFKVTLNASIYDLDHAFEKANEESTIVYFVEDLNQPVALHQIQDTLLIIEEAEVILSKLLRSPYKDWIDDVRPAPHLLIMRAIGDLPHVLDKIHSDLGGDIGSFKEILDSGNDKTTLVALTEKPLNRSIKLADFYDRVLKLDGNHFSFLRELRMHALTYLNTGISNKDWYEIEIRIYDRFSAYKLHYDRLIELFEGLELGFILGESWSKDYPRFLMSVEVYRVRFFTFKEPKTIKWFLLGMEYLEDGTRIVDYDVYYNHKKIDWLDTLRENAPRTRHLAGLKARGEIMERLDQKSIENIALLESDIIKTRY